MLALDDTYLISFLVQGMLQTLGGYLSITDSIYYDRIIISLLSLLFCLLSVLCGKKFVHRLAVIFLVILLFAFSSLIIGISSSSRLSEKYTGVTGPSIYTLHGNLWPVESFKFSEAMLLLVPCFIGLYSGVNNARQLKNPVRSIPFGAILSIIISLIIYSLIFCLLSSSIERDLLIHDSMVGPTLGWPSWWILVPGIYL